MRLNKVSGPVLKYYEDLLRLEILKEEDSVLIDPLNSDWSENISDVIVLQQGQCNWDKVHLNKVKLIITSSIYLYEIFNPLKKTYLIPFSINPIFKKITSWKERENALYYHGRIIPGKLGIMSLIKLSNSGIKIVLRGPTCKDYWTDKDLELIEFVTYKDKISKLNIEFLPSTNDKNILAEDLNKYKYYFTLSNGEAFNLALQEAIACGTIPIVRPNDAYWWADHLLLCFKTAEELIEKFNSLKNEDMEEYSNLISREIHKRYSEESIIKSYNDQKKDLFPE